ncbi:MAG: TIGR03943 family protein [Lactobacillales bacterium]|jgi:putative membrane protein|nr:TIGR03943 family protein [Lactobacillales bacterium]
MTRFLIFAGYFVLMLYLVATHTLDQYINLNYSYLSYISMAISFVLAIYELSRWIRRESRLPKISAIVLLIIPIFVGFFFPQVNLDATIVASKGLHLPVSQDNTGDAQMKTQYLAPNTSMYFSSDEYAREMRANMKPYKSLKSITVDDANFLVVMELIYDYPEEFAGKTLTYTGFVYQNFVLRFGIIHCVADSGVFGLQILTSEKLVENEWYTVSGKIEVAYSKSLKRNVPSVEGVSVVPAEKPSNPYVYRIFK